MSFEFQSTLVNVTPTFRIGGNQIGGVRIEYANNIKVARVIVTNDADVKFALSGPFEAGDPDAIYAALAPDLYEVATGILLNEGAIGSVDSSNGELIIDLEGDDRRYKFVPDAVVTGPEEYADHTWKLPQASFDALVAAAATWRSSMDGTLEGLSNAITTEVSDRIAADAAIQADVDQNEADADAAIAAEIARVDALIATDMWLFADQAAFPPAADNHGRVVHSHADASIYYSHGGMWHKIENEAEAQAARDLIQADVDQNEVDSDAADAALSGRLDVLEADPTTATAVAAVQADVDQNEADSDAAEAALSGRLDVLEADPTTATAVAAVQADVDQNEADSDAAEAALSGRLDVLEADPTTATAVAAVQADVDQNEADGDAADAALSGRLDVLEADPTTATAVAAVQADVDQNEADADAALALKAPLADPDFTGVLEVDSSARLEFDSNLTKLHNVLRSTSVTIGNNIQLNPAAADGRVEIEGGLYLRPSDLVNAADDTAAAAAGVIVGQIYHNSGALRIRLS
jgi:hypothetical protein